MDCFRHATTKLLCPPSGPAQHRRLSIFNITTHARSRREQTRTNHIFLTVFIRHFRHDECFSISRLFFHAHVPLRLLSPFLLYPTRQSVLRPDSAVPRSANCLGFTLLFSSPPHSPSICLFDITLHSSPRPLIDTLRSRPAYIFSNPALTWLPRAIQHIAFCSALWKLPKTFTTSLEISQTTHTYHSQCLKIHHLSTVDHHPQHCLARLGL
jgi:hypothetical protein